MYVWLGRIFLGMETAQVADTYHTRTKVFSLFSHAGTVQLSLAKIERA
jgi:hypothetical protein